MDQLPRSTQAKLPRVESGRVDWKKRAQPPCLWWTGKDLQLHSCCLLEEQEGCQALVLGPVGLQSVVVGRGERQELRGWILAAEGETDGGTLGAGLVAHAQSGHRMGLA